MVADQVRSGWTLFEYVGGPHDGELSPRTLHTAQYPNEYVLRSSPPHLGATAGWQQAVARATSAFNNGVPDAYVRMIWNGDPSSATCVEPIDAASQVDRLQQVLRSGEDYEARLIATSFCAHNPSKTDLIELLLVPAMRIVHELWAAGEEPTYVQHRASAIIHGILGDHSAASTHLSGHRVVVATVTGETRTLPARMAAVVLREDGWQVEEVVGPLPPQELVDAAIERQLDLVVLSTTCAAALPAAEQVQQLLEPLGIPVIIGTLEHSFYELQRLARRISLVTKS